MSDTWVLFAQAYTPIIALERAVGQMEDEGYDPEDSMRYYRITVEDITTPPKKPQMWSCQWEKMQGYTTAKLHSPWDANPGNWAIYCSEKSRILQISGHLESIDAPTEDEFWASVTMSSGMEKP